MTEDQDNRIDEKKGGPVREEDCEAAADLTKKDYGRLPHCVTRQLMRQLSPVAFCCFLAILDETWFWRLWQKEIPFETLHKTTGMSDFRTIQKGLKELETKELIAMTQEHRKRTRTFRPRWETLIRYKDGDIPPDESV